jgi:hypothetical protein
VAVAMEALAGGGEPDPAGEVPLTRVARDAIARLAPWWPRLTELAG